jgi:hypothetical protein
MNELERKPYSSESMRVRCPQCRKLYLVQFNDVKEAKPRFECVQCRTRFWLSLPDSEPGAEMQGIPIQAKESNSKPKRIEKENTNSMQPCPKCFKSVHKGIQECPHCGVIIAKLKDLSFSETTLNHSESLSSAWKKVISNYADEEVHSDFLRIAQKERNLHFAAAQYGQMQKLMPSDETTQKRMSELKALGSIMVPEAGNNLKKARLSRLWQVPFAASVLMMAIGLIFPVFRNMVGVGAAFFFIAKAVQFQLRRRYCPPGPKSFAVS